MKADQNEKLSERSEFLSFPLACGRRGQPKAAKRQGRLFFGSFLWTSKEMNEKNIFSWGYIESILTGLTAYIPFDSSQTNRPKTRTSTTRITRHGHMLKISGKVP